MPAEAIDMGAGKKPVCFLCPRSNRLSTKIIMIKRVFVTLKSIADALEKSAKNSQKRSLSCVEAV